MSTISFVRTNLRRLEKDTIYDVTPSSVVYIFITVGLISTVLILLLSICPSKKKNSTVLRNEDFLPSHNVLNQRKIQKVKQKLNVGTAGETSTAYYSMKLPGTGNILAIKPEGLVKSHKSTVTHEDRAEVTHMRQYAISKRTMIPSTGNQTVQTVTTVLVERELSVKTENKLKKMKYTLIKAVILASKETLGYHDFPDYDTDVKGEGFIRKDSKGALINLIPLEAYLEKLRQCVNQWTDDEDDSGTSMGAKCLVVSHIYLARIKKNTPDLDITHENVRNLCLISVMLATKFLDDWVIPVRFWAELVSCESSVLNEMEANFSEQMNYEFFVSQQRLDKTVHSLYKRVK